jgi:predicted TIM-barrel fold metal-dependent hydrolase
MAGSLADLTVPVGACDTHVHILGPSDRYPYWPGRTYTPPDASAGELKALHTRLRISAAVLVQPSVYGTDNSRLVAGLKEAGGQCRGVVVIDTDVADSELAALAAAGVRGARLNLATFSSEARDDPATAGRIRAIAGRIAGHGWHLQLYARPREILAHADLLASLPTPVVLDHFGCLRAECGPDSPVGRNLLELVRSAGMYVKLSAPYRISPDAADQRIGELVQAFAAAVPDGILWASDWPHTGSADGRRGGHAVSSFIEVDDAAVLARFLCWLPTEHLRVAALVANPGRLYGFDYGP